MEERLKQRLVGAVVLASLAVVLVPILFDMPPGVDERTSAHLISGIPERPEDGFGPPASDMLGLPQTSHLDAEMALDRTRSAPKVDSGGHDGSFGTLAAGAASSVSGGNASTTFAGATGEETPEIRAESSPAVSEPTPRRAGGESEGGAAGASAGGWTVQLGSFLKAENALALRKRLRAGGYAAFVEIGSSAQGDVSRVFVGPMPDREQAKTSAAELRREMALEGIVVPYPGG